MHTRRIFRKDLDGCGNYERYVIIYHTKEITMNDKKVQWHPGFVAAMNLEFAENRDGLIFEKEYNLSTKPLEIDLLVIK